MKICNSIFTGIALCVALPLMAQPLDFDRYMTAVREKNVGYLAEKYNIDIATARLRAAHVFNDPELSFAYSNNQDQSLHMGQSYETGLSYNFSLGGVRRARIGVAGSEKELAAAAVEEYFRNLQAEAAVAWAMAWQMQQQERLAYSSYEAMRQIAQSDSARLRVGEINETDAVQSHLESQTLYNEWLGVRSEAKNAKLRLSVYMGGGRIDSLPVMLLTPPDESLSPADRCAYAEEYRSDLRVAEQMKNLSEQNLKLVQATRALELGLNAGYSYSTEVKNEIAPAPAFNGFTVGMSIPLKFSAMNRGEKRAAQFAVTQSETAYEAVRQQIHSEVMQACNGYEAAREIAARYNRQMLGEAERVLKNRTFGYLHGESGLLELLTARRTYNDVYRSYLEAQCTLFTAYYELRRVTGR